MYLELMNRVAKRTVFYSKIRSDESGKSSVIVERLKNGAWDNGFKVSYSS